MACLSKTLSNLDQSVLAELDPVFVFAVFNGSQCILMAVVLLSGLLKLQNIQNLVPGQSILHLHSWKKQQLIAAKLSQHSLICIITNMQIKKQTTKTNYNKVKKKIPINEMNNFSCLYLLNIHASKKKKKKGNPQIDKVWCGLAF